MSTKPTRSDNDVLTYGKNFMTAADEHKTEIGLSDQDLSLLAETYKDFTTQLELATALKLKAAAATTAKDQARSKFLERVQLSKTKTSATEGVPDNLKLELGITIRSKTRNALLPVTPADLVANIKTDGSVEIYWLRNGNTPSTQYILEMQADQTAAWTIVDIITRTSYLHLEPPALNEIRYRVSARRRTDVSSPSNTATVLLRRPVVS